MQIRIQLCSGGQTAVAAFVVFFITLHVRLNRAADTLEPRTVVIGPEVEIVLHYAGVAGLDHMGRGGVHESDGQVRNHNGVQRVRVAGTENVLDGIAGRLGVPGDAAHKRGLSAARTAFDQIDRLSGLQID